MQHYNCKSSFEHFGFGDTGVDRGPNAIVIIEPNTGIPPHLKERGGPEKEWD